MPRPKIQRRLQHKQNVTYFKPQGIPMRALKEIILLQDELEALKLYNIDNLDQTEAAKKMNISQPTFARTLKSAYIKLSDGVINGKAIKIES